MLLSHYFQKLFLAFSLVLFSFNSTLSQNRDYKLATLKDGSSLMVDKNEKFDHILSPLSAGAIKEQLNFVKDSLGILKDIRIVSCNISGRSGNTYAIANYDNRLNVYFIVYDLRKFNDLGLFYQMIVIGHELGHCITNHLVSPNHLKPKRMQQEREADQISGYINRHIPTKVPIMPFWIDYLFPKNTRIQIYNFDREKEYRKGYETFEMNDIYKLVKN